MLVSLRLPDSSTPFFSYNSVLDTTEYKFTFNYSVRNLCWYLTVYNILGELLVSNIKLVPHYDLMGCFASKNLPKGTLTLVSDSAYEKPPAITLENLSTDFTLVYDDGQ